MFVRRPHLLATVRTFCPWHLTPFTVHTHDEMKAWNNFMKRNISFQHPSTPSSGIGSEFRLLCFIEHATYVHEFWCVQSKCGGWRVPIGESRAERHPAVCVGEGSASDASRLNFQRFDVCRLFDFSRSACGSTCVGLRKQGWRIVDAKDSPDPSTCHTSCFCCFSWHPRMEIRSFGSSKYFHVHAGNNHSLAVCAVHGPRSYSATELEF